MVTKKRKYNGVYDGEYLGRVAFPLGGIGAGMICLEGTGKLSHVSVRNKPDILNEPRIFSALHVKDIEYGTRILEGPIPDWKVFYPWGKLFSGSGSGGMGKDYGLPRFETARFCSRFPFGTVELSDRCIPLSIDITGWSPFLPGDEDNSSLPVAALEYGFHNTGSSRLEAVYSFNSVNFMATQSEGSAVRPAERGFVLWQEGTKEKPWERGAFCISTTDPEVRVNHAWFRGGWFDATTMVWNETEKGSMPERPAITEGDPSPGGSLFVPFVIDPGESKTVRVLLSWYVPFSSLRWGKGLHDERQVDSSPGCKSSSYYYQPWYAGRYESIEDISSYWRSNYERLRDASETFRDCFYDTTLPDEVVEAVSANLSILKSPTILRQTDGRLWCWEGCHDETGSCWGSCTHVWNYAQALSHLFPNLERSLRQTEFHEGQDDAGHQAFRVPLPIRDSVHETLAASDGQLGGIIKVYRDWRISGDTDWMKDLWPLVKKSLSYCIETWDPNHRGVLEEPHHNTYDIEFWGPDGMCSSIYLGALKAAIPMGEAVGDDVASYKDILDKGVVFLENELFDGEYFVQRIQWQGLGAGYPTEVRALAGDAYSSPEAVELLRKEGPKYQYGAGCLSDGVLGAWLAAVSGVGEFLDPDKVSSHLRSVHKYNLKEDLSKHSNPQRPTFALGREGGLLLCSWPKGGRPSLPFVCSNEVFTGIEYQVASHLMLQGHVKEGLEMVRTCRDRYDGRVRNPFDEYECGHWYARAMSSYALLQGLTGVVYDAVEKVLTVEPKVSGELRAFISTATGYGTVVVQDDRVCIEIRSGKIEVKRTDYVPYSGDAQKGK